MSLPERAQAIDCGGRWLAFGLGWARLALEHPELSSVPEAPAWLVGAANVEGEVVPVIDLANWLDADALTPREGRETRLLVGGQGEQSLGLLFTGLPRLVRVLPPPMGLLAPEALAPLVLGVAADDLALFVLDGAAMLERLTLDLNPN